MPALGHVKVGPCPRPALPILASYRRGNRGDCETAKPMPPPLALAPRAHHQLGSLGWGRPYLYATAPAAWPSETPRFIPVQNKTSIINRRCNFLSHYCSLQANSWLLTLTIRLPSTHPFTGAYVLHPLYLAFSARWAWRYALTLWFGFLAIRQELSRISTT